MLGGRRRPRSRRPYRGSYGYGPLFGRPRSRSRSRTGFFGPFPYYTRQTGGGRVSVGGCCLPIALAFPAAGAVAVRQLLRR